MIKGISASIVFFIFFCFVSVITNSAFASGECKDILGASLNPLWVMSKLDDIKSTETPSERRVRDATANYGFEAVALNNEVLKFDTLYTKTVYPTDTVDQSYSGTCWIFAQLNVYRTSMVKAGLVLPEFKFSTNFVHFFDMLEKSNTRLVEAMLAAEKFSTEIEIYREVRAEIGRVSDGGWSNYLPQLVEKYGLVPYQSMPDTYATQYSDVMINEVNRQVSNVIHQIIQKSIDLKLDRSLNRTARMAEMLKIKEIGMSAVTKILVTHLGHPPSEVDTSLNYAVKKSGKVLKTSLMLIKNMSPTQFARKIVEFNKDDFVVIRHYPSLAPGHYVVKRSSIGITSGTETKYDLHFLNLRSGNGADRMQQLVMKSINAGIAVEFSADIGQNAYSPYGILDPKIYDREGLYGLSSEERGEELSKRYELLLGETSPAHAMVFTGYDARDGKGKPPRRFLVKNSWGIYVGAKMEGEKNKSVQDGDFHMNRSWFDKYVFDINVPRRMLNKKEHSVLEDKPQVISYEDFSEL